MANIWGHSYTRREIEARVGTMKQIAEVRRAVLTDGREDGTKVIDLRQGALQATVAEGRCLDLSSLSYRGTPLGFTGKNGLVYAGFAEPAENPLRSVNGGMFYTCGLSNVGGRYGDDYFHGRIRLCPAENVTCEADWVGDDYRMRICGIMRQNGVCYENLSLARCIETELGSNSILISDRVHNEGFRGAPFMMMYHVVFGYPLLNDEAVIYLPDGAGMDAHGRTAAAPTADGQENGGGLFKTVADKDGFSHYCLYNPTLQLGLGVSYLAKHMPYLSQWKSMQSGDYAMGLMPSTCKGAGRQTEIEGGTLEELQPDETRDFQLCFTAIDGADALALFRGKIDSCTVSKE